MVKKKPAASKFRDVARPAAAVEEGDRALSACRTPSTFRFSSGVASALRRVEDEIGSINLDVREDGGHVSVNWGNDLCQIVADSTPVRSALACVSRSFAEATKKSRSNLKLTYGTLNQDEKDRILASEPTVTGCSIQLASYWHP